ncbi:hypothetical protein [Pseudomonas brassicacearum]|uniref:hypothetical protein n=1 Tax=Pseudomonas brassicacearum TaxID=930166 RepID=UPI001E38B07A|nr:hypothetical protein [Pseudomonas brassicacearum]
MKDQKIAGFASSYKATASQPGNSSEISYTHVMRLFDRRIAGSLFPRIGSLNPSAGHPD